MVPAAVIGGLEIVLFGFIATNGLKVVVNEHVDFSKVRNVFVVATMLIVGIGGLTIGGVSGKLTIQFGGTALAMFTGITLNLLLPKDRGIDPNKMPKIANKKVISDKEIKEIDITNDF